MGKSKWDERKADIQRMVNQDMTDGQIGVVYGVTGMTVYQARKRLGIPSKPKLKSKNLRTVFAAQDPLPPLEAIDSYVDEEGRTVSRYPARYAANCVVQPYTARPRRG